MKKIARALLLFVFCAAAIRAGAAEPVRTLEITGFTEKTKEAIDARFPQFKSGHWTLADLDLLIQYLVRDQQYDSASAVKESEYVYRLNVGRVRRIANLEFQGNSALSESDLRRETGLSEKSPFDPGLLVEAGEKIRAFYETLGFPKTQVDLKYEDSQKSEVDVTVVIREGPRTLIDDFKIQTPNVELERVLRSVLRKFKNDPLMPKTIAEMRGRAREELSENGFWRTDLPDPTVELNFEESRAVLTFRINQSNQYFLEANGNLKEPTSNIRKSLGLDLYFSANPNIAGEIGSKVKAYYLSQGYPRSTVQSEEVDGVRPWTKRIDLKIEEGPQVKIDRFEFSGTFSQPPKTYIDFIMSHSSEQIADKFYVKDDLDDALKNLVTDRWNQGYLRARIVSTRTVYNKERDKVTVLVNLEEGPLTEVQKIAFEGNTNIAETDLLRLLRIEAGKPLRLSDLDAAVLRLKQYYRDHGFLEMSLVNEHEDLVTYNEDNTLVHLNFKIQEGPQVRVASILVEGNNITQERVIMKELEFKKGDILTPQAIDESTSRLQRLGHFSSVEIRTLEEKTQIAERTVVVKVQDRDPGLFNVGAGVTNERGLTLRGYTGIAYRNIGGSGRGVSLRLDGNYNVNEIHYLERKITFGYLEPYIFDTRVRGRVNLTRSTSVSDFDKKQASEINQTTWSLEQDITSHLLVTWDVLSVATVSDFFLEGPENKSTLNIGSTGLTTDLDFRNHPFNPTQGTFTRLNVEYGSPRLGSSETIEYFRSYGTFTHYQPLSKTPGWVWANSIRGGYLKNLMDDGAVPFDKKGFLLGGQSTLRGFTPDEAFPNRYDFGDIPRFNLTTSATMTLFKSEIRFPVWGNIGGAVFYDGGQVKVVDQNFDQGWRDSIGVALRYITPVGAVSLEYGWKIKPRGDRNENPSVFHFSIGTF